MINLLALGTLVNLWSYLFFLLLEWLKPGFVANFFSVHLFLLGALIFGFFWAKQKDSSGWFGGRIVLWPFVFMTSIIFAVFAWKEGSAFADERLLVALAAFVVPWILYHYLKK